MMEEDLAGIFSRQYAGDRGEADRMAECCR